MKVNLRPKTGEKRRSTSGPSNNNPNPNSSIDDFRNYITELESLLKDALYENIKLKYEKKSQSIEMKKQQQKADEIIKKYSVGKIYLDNFEKILNQTYLKLLALSKDKNLQSNDFGNVINEDNSEISSIKEKYENKIEKLENDLRVIKKEKEDIKNKYQNEFELMSSVIYNLGFVYWSMKSDYEDKLKQNKGWLEMERIKQYNGDY